MTEEAYYDESKTFLPKKCTECGWSYYHPLSDCWADYAYDCPSCKSERTLATCGDKVVSEPRQIALKRVHLNHITK